jgi:DNA repair protein RadC
MAKSAMELANNRGCAELQPPRTRIDRQRLLDFMGDDFPKVKKAVSNKTSASIAMHEAFASVKRVSLIYEKSLSSRPCITSTKDAISLFKDYWKQMIASDQERFVVACLDTKHRVQSVVEITVGTLDASLVHPREVFKPAILEGSSSILLSHNHPSGNPTPSREDILVTDRLIEVGKLIGINVLDHIIYGDGTGESISIREST